MSSTKRTNSDTGRPKRSKRAKRTKDDAAEESDGNKEWDRDLFRVCVVYDHDDGSEFEPGECYSKLFYTLGDKQWYRVDSGGARALSS